MDTISSDSRQALDACHDAGVDWAPGGALSHAAGKVSQVGDEYQASAVSMRDVWEALTACRQDHGVPVRLVLYERMEATAPGVVCIVAQPCASQEAITDAELVARQSWPTNRFRTLTAALHWCVWDVYQRIDRQREAAAQVAAKRE